MTEETKHNKAILFSDLHASTKELSNLYEIIIQNPEIKLIISAGDFVNMGEPVWFVDKLINVIADSGLPFVWAPGNNDFGRSYYKLNAKYKSVEGRVVEECGLKFTGVGGSPASWAGQYAGESMIDRKKIGGTVFISHYPPPGVLNLQLKDIPTPLLIGKKLKVESEKSNSKLIIKNSLKTENFKFENLSAKHFSDSPLIHICGHLHYRWGTTYVGQTKVVQLASLETGHYAIMDLKTLTIEFKRIGSNGSLIS